MVASDGYLIGFDIGGTRLKSGVVRVDGTVERAELEDHAGVLGAAAVVMSALEETSP